MIKRVVGAAAAIAALMAAVGCAVVALCFTVFSLLRDMLGAPGAGAVIFGLTAVIALIAALIAWNSVKAPRIGGGARYDRNVPPPTMAETALGLVRERPIITAGIALAAGVAAFANPALVTAALRAFTDRPRNRP